MKWITRRAVVRIGATGSAFAIPYLYGATQGRSSVVVENSNCPLLPQHSGLDGMRIAVMADFHFDETHDGRLVDRAIELSNELDPHLVLLPGDFISHIASATPALAGHLEQLRAKLGVFASLGNHDHWSGAETVSRALLEAGISVLRNESRTLDYHGTLFAVTGLDSAWGGQPDPKRAVEDLPSDIPQILSMHEPDYYDMLPTMTVPRPLLQVSGHTHGGQVCAPFIGPLILPSWGKKYAAGPYGEAGASLYVTRGIGTIGPNARFLCRPEVSMITLRKQ